MSIKSEHVKQWRKNMKQKVVISMGGKCQICNYNRCNDALELHHIDPNEKEFQLGKIMAHPVKWEKIVEEAKKCILLCSNCHKEIHKGIVSIPEIYQQFNEFLLYTEEAKQLIFIKAPDQMTQCPVCNKNKPKHNKFCSLSCSSKANIKINWDSIDLLDLIDNKNYTKTYIAEMMNCSIQSVNKRYKKLKTYMT